MRRLSAASQAAAACTSGTAASCGLIWHQSGVVARELAERSGHSRASITLDVYSHVMPLEEASVKTLAELARESG
jgi:hypothetical protein